MPTYAITGITGHVGGAAARHLIAAGATVRAVVRNEAGAAPWRGRGAEFAVAALDDASTLRRAVEGVDGVFVMTPTWFEADDMFAENARALAALGEALRTVPEARIVLLSSVGAHRPQGTGAIMKLHEMEAAFSDLPSVASVRAGWFMENFAGLIPHVRQTGTLSSMLAPLDRPIPMVATADIGQAVAALLQQDWSGRRVIELEGPRRYSPTDVAAAFGAVLGRVVTAQTLPRTDWLAAFLSWGLTPRSADAMAEMLDGFNSGRIAYENNEADMAHGLTPLEAVLAGLARS